MSRLFQHDDPRDWPASAGARSGKERAPAPESPGNGHTRGHCVECEEGRGAAEWAQREAGATLHLDAVLLDVDPADRERALALAADHIGAMHALDAAMIFRALERREQAGSTALGQGVAIPHARIDGIDRPVIVFMRCRQAIDFDAPDGRPISMLLVILVPEAGDAESHLQLLASIAGLFTERSFRAALNAPSTVAQVETAFAEGTAPRESAEGRGQGGSETTSLPESMRAKTLQNAGAG